ncbi:helix-turn-helix transcriptional regulator [Flavobacterium sp. MAH-1]|uniref:Helix-turn-helix transcriptional regulator n=1 Tax=Flavobacterium agri TaxID=2743471 RepID=A0A7Y9C4V7_9FLAO|nr:helix-turn-helix transcriptional regulator [Flavobacterium agri]NUY80265.1 helix-turn-helix transcriptional regulator [Flavobacterium agri]NYA70290.1 helix-turn-helix transcriptional regulator [Flavobacterium agri]
MELNDIVGSRIKALRLEKKISQETLAGLADIDRTYMQSIEKGQRNISIDMLRKLAKALGTTMSAILQDID